MDSPVDGNPINWTRFHKNHGTDRLQSVRNITRRMADFYKKEPKLFILDTFFPHFPT